MTFFFLVYITSQIRTLVRAWCASLWLNPLLESAVIPFECWFVSVLLYFPSNSFACGLAKQQRMAQGFRTLHPCERPEGGSWFWIGSASGFKVAQLQLLWLLGDWMQRQKIFFSVTVSLFSCLSNKIINLRKEKLEP